MKLGVHGPVEKAVVGFWFCLMSWAQLSGHTFGALLFQKVFAELVFIRSLVSGLF